MINGLIFYYYVLSLINEKILPVALMFAPAFMLAFLTLTLSFTAHGKFISGAFQARRFVKKAGLLTSENAGIFFEKCIKRLPAVFALTYKAAESVEDYSALEGAVLKPLFKGRHKLMLALYDGIIAVLIVLNIAAALVKGEGMSLILFAAFAHLPLIIFSRLLYIAELYLFESRGKRAYLQLVSIIKNEWAGNRRFLKD